jgi:hypothetical protein
MTTQPVVLSEPYFQEKEFADFMRKNIRTVRLWEQLRIGPPRVKIGKTVLYRKSAVEAWLRSRESRPCRSPRARHSEAA